MVNLYRKALTMSEPASVLLKRIRDEKERLIKESKIKRSKKTKATLLQVLFATCRNLNLAPKTSELHQLMRHSGAALALTLTISLTLGANVVAKHSTEHKILFWS